MKKSLSKIRAYSKTGIEMFPKWFVSGRERQRHKKEKSQNIIEGKAYALCTIFIILLTLWNSEQKNGLLIKLFCFSSDFDETWWNCSTHG